MMQMSKQVLWFLHKVSTLNLLPCVSVCRFLEWELSRFYVRPDSFAVSCMKRQESWRKYDQAKKLYVVHAGLWSSNTSFLLIFLCWFIWHFNLFSHFIIFLSLCDEKFVMMRRWTEMTRRTLWLFCKYRRSANAFALHLLTKVGGTELWSSMAEWAGASRTKLAHFRASPICSILHCVFTRGNSVIPIRKYIMLGRIGIILYWVWRKPKMEILILVLNIRHFDRNGSLSHSQRVKNECQKFKCALQNAVRLRFHWRLRNEWWSKRGAILCILQ